MVSKALDLLKLINQVYSRLTLILVLRSRRATLANFKVDKLKLV